MTDVGVRLRQARHSLNLSLRDVAGEMGISFSHLDRIESGQANPTAKMIERILAFYESYPERLRDRLHEKV